MNKLEQINRAVNDIREMVGASCTPISELPAAVAEWGETNIGGGFTSAFVFSTKLSPVIPDTTELDMETGLVKELGEDWFQTTSTSATRNSLQQTNTVWLTYAVFNSEGVRITEWMTPVNIKGAPGAAGSDGEKGEQGDKGDQGEPGITYRTVMAYTTTDTTDAPQKPYGGVWNITSNVVTNIQSVDGHVWSTDVSDGELKYRWISENTFDMNGSPIGEWSVPFRITGEDGENGVDGTNIEFIYRQLPSMDIYTSLSAWLETNELEITETGVVPETKDSFTNTKWTASPSGISEENPIEVVCTRQKNEESWGKWSNCVLWAKWGEDGTDGDGVEYIYLITPTKTEDGTLITSDIVKTSAYMPDRDAALSNSAYQENEFCFNSEFGYSDYHWTDEPSDVGPYEPLEWVSIRKKENGTWGKFSDPKLWAKWAKDGEPGQDGASVKIEGKFATIADIQSAWTTYVESDGHDVSAFFNGSDGDFTISLGDGWFVEEDGKVYVYTSQWTTDSESNEFNDYWISIVIRGVSGYTLNLTNDVITVPLEEDGSFDQDFATTEPITCDIELYGENGLITENVQYSINQTNNVGLYLENNKVIFYPSFFTSHDLALPSKITCTAIYNNVILSRDILINVTKNAYELLLEKSVLHYDENGLIDKTIKLEVERWNSSANKYETVTSGINVFLIIPPINGNSHQIRQATFNDNLWVLDIEGLNVQNVSSVKIYVGSEESTSTDVYAGNYYTYENIAIVTNGKDGQDGEPGIVFELSDDQITLPIENGQIDPDLENHPVSITLSLYSGFTKIDNNAVTYSCDVDGIEIENGIATINFTESVRNILFSKDYISFTATYNGTPHTKNCSLKKVANAYELVVNKTIINLSDEGYFIPDSDGKILGFTLKKWNDTKWETANITMDCNIRLHYYPGYESNAASGTDVDGKAYTGSRFTFTNGEGRWFNAEVNLKQSKFQWVNEIIAEITIDGELYQESISCLRDERALHLELTNEFTMVPTDSTGNVDSNWDEESDEGQDLAISTAQLYIGSERVTDNVTWSWAIVSGEGTLEDATTDTCSLVTMTSDSVTIECTATFANRTISKEMNVVKSKGQAVYKLVPSASLFTYDKNGNPSPSSITIAIQKWDSGKYSNVTASDEGLELSASTLSPKKESQTVTLKKGGVVLDEETIGFVESGTDGADGKDGAGYLKNLLVDSASLTVSNGFKKFLLPVRVSTGDVFTFKAEGAHKIEGSSSNFMVDLWSLSGVLLWQRPTVNLQYDLPNVYQTFTVTADCKDILAELVIYSGKADSYNATINFTNFSLVKGSKPMEEWEDYKGDEGLVNLLTCDYNYEGNHNSYNYFNQDGFTINAGETYTLSWEDLDYTGTNLPYALFTVDSKSASRNHDQTLNKGQGWCTLTIRDYLQEVGGAVGTRLVNNLVSKFFISNNSSKDATATIKGLSLVKGSRPMMKWKSGKPIENGGQGPQGPPGANGQPGEDAFVFDITNNSEMVPCDGEGTVDSTWSTQTTMTLYKGSTPVTEGVTYKVNGETVTSNIVTINKNHVSELSSKVKCEAVYNGVTYTKEMTLTKAIGVTAYRLVPSATAIRRDKNGNFTPTSVTATVMGWSNGKWVNSKQGIVEYSSNDSSWSPNTVSPSDTISNIYIRLLANDGTTVLDKETIPIIWDGTDGQPGGKGDPGVSPTITKKYALSETTTEPTNEEFIHNTPQVTTPSNKYGWCMETLTQASGTTTNKYIISVHGETGPSGVGSTGAQGPIIYPAGAWRADAPYSHTVDTNGNITATPYVFWAGADTKVNAYYKLLTNVTGSSNPTPNNDSQHWQKIEYFDSIFADVGFFNQATVGQMVFHQNYVFSQQGVGKVNNESVTDYSKFTNPQSAIAAYMNNRHLGSSIDNLSTWFCPNICFDVDKGDVILGGGSIYTYNDGTLFYGKNTIIHPNTLDNILRDVVWRSSNGEYSHGVGSSNFIYLLSKLIVPESVITNPGTFTLKLTNINHLQEGRRFTIVFCGEGLLGNKKTKVTKLLKLLNDDTEIGFINCPDGASTSVITGATMFHTTYTIQTNSVDVMIVKLDNKLYAVVSE